MLCHTAPQCLLHPQMEARRQGCCGCQITAHSTAEHPCWRPDSFLSVAESREHKGFWIGLLFFFFFFCVWQACWEQLRAQLMAATKASHTHARVTALKGSYKKDAGLCPEWGREGPGTTSPVEAVEGRTGACAWFTLCDQLILEWLLLNFPSALWASYIREMDFYSSVTLKVTYSLELHILFCLFVCFLTNLISSILFNK